MFLLAFVAAWLQGHWWGFISRNYVVWPTFLLMNVFAALKGSHFRFLLVISLLVLRAGCGIWLYQFLIIAYLFTLLIQFGIQQVSHLHIHTHYYIIILGTWSDGLYHVGWMSSYHRITWDVNTPDQVTTVIICLLYTFFYHNSASFCLNIRKTLEFSIWRL